MGELVIAQMRKRLDAYHGDSVRKDDVREWLDVVENAYKEPPGGEFEPALLTDEQLAGIIDQSLASLKARFDDPHGDWKSSMNDDLRDQLEECCDRWDEFANELPGFREEGAEPDAEQPWAVGITATCQELRRFDTHDEGAEFISTLTGHEKGIYFLDGPPAHDVKERLEYLRQELRAERISLGELSELQDLAEHIDSGDTELLEAAGVPEHPVHTDRKAEEYDWMAAAQERGEALDQLIAGVRRLGLANRLGGTIARADEILEGVDLDWESDCIGQRGDS